MTPTEDLISGSDRALSLGLGKISESFFSKDAWIWMYLVNRMVSLTCIEDFIDQVSLSSATLRGLVTSKVACF